MSSSPLKKKHRPHQEDISGWASLANDILLLIAERLGTVTYYLRFRAVCRRWRSVPIPPCIFSPLLLLPFDPDAASLPLFDPSDGNLYSLPLPEARHKAFLGSSHGWLAFIDASGAVSLLNPLTRNRLRLPPIAPRLALASKVVAVRVYGGGWITVHNSDVNPVTLYHMRNTFISEVTLSCSPSSSSDCLALAVLSASSKIAFCRLGDAEWELLETGLPGTVKSVAYADQRLFAVNNSGEVAVCCLGPPTTVERASPLVLARRCNAYKILATGDELLLVAQYDSARSSPCFRRHYAIYRLRSSGEGSIQSYKVESLKDMTVFLSVGFNLNAICGKFSICKKNAVYLSEAVVGSARVKRTTDHHIQVVDFANGSWEVVSCNRMVQSLREITWFMPHLF